MSSLLEAFNNYFELIPADSEALKREVYMLRYQVYCLEAKFENPEHYPNGIESDEYDDVSAHYLVRHRETQLFAATTRMILPGFSREDGLFPIQRHTQIERVDLISGIPPDKVGEASRFCVSKDFKRRKNEAGTSAGIPSDWNQVATEEERRMIPHITIGLFACLVKMSAEHGLDYWYAVMEPALVRFFTTLGIYFIAIGPACEYHGKRVPYTIKMENLLNGVFDKNPEFYDLISHRGEFDCWTKHRRSR